MNHPLCRPCVALLLLAGGALPAAEAVLAVGQKRYSVSDDAAPGVRAAAPEITVWPAGTPRTAAHALILTREISFRPRVAGDLPVIAARYGLILGDSPVAGCGVGTVPGADAWQSVTLATTMAQDPAVLWAEPVVKRHHAIRAVPDDTKYSLQKGYLDLMNMEAAWGQSVTGAGVNIAIVDEGIDLTHPDLTVRTDLDKDVVSNDTDASPVRTNENHGTMVAGVAAAKGFNNLGVCGVAPSASVIPVRLLDPAASVQTDAQDAAALGYQITPALTTDQVMISNSSWGPDDTGTVTAGPGSLALDALNSGFINGRSGKGIVYVWASGNGAASDDNLSYDGFGSTRYAIAVGSIGQNGTKASYSETGPALFCTAPGGDFNFGEGMITTDRQGNLGVNTTALTGGDYTRFSDGEVGTSFSAPMVAGVVALMLEARPALTARDVRHILASTAQKNSSTDGGWLTNGAGLHWNPKFGFGLVDANAAVTAAKTATLKPIPSNPWSLSSTSAVNTIPDGTGFVRYTFTFTARDSQAFHAEWAELTVKTTHPRQGDLEYSLTSPLGTKAVFARRSGDTTAAVNGWMFTSVATWNELAAGQWTVDLKDLVRTNTGSINGMTLTLHGYREDGFTSNPLGAFSPTSSTVDLGDGTGGGGTTPGGSTETPAASTGGGGCGAGGGSGGLAALTLLVGLRTLRRRRA